MQRLNVLSALRHSTLWAVALSVLVAEWALSVPDEGCTPAKGPVCAGGGACSVCARHGVLTEKGLFLCGSVTCT